MRTETEFSAAGLFFLSNRQLGERKREEWKPEGGSRHLSARVTVRDWIRVYRTVISSSSQRSRVFSYPVVLTIKNALTWLHTRVLHEDSPPFSFFLFSLSHSTISKVDRLLSTQHFFDFRSCLFSPLVKSNIKTMIIGCFLFGLFTSRKTVPSRSFFFISFIDRKRFYISKNKKETETRAYSWSNSETI